jgi:hypothetical protein
VTEEMTDIEHPKCNIEEAASSCSPNNI